MRVPPLGRRFGIRRRLLAVLALASAVTVAIQYSLYFKMLIDLPAFAWLAVATGLAGALSAGIVYAFTRPILSDVEVLAEAARRVAAGEFRTSVRVHSHGELAALADTFNMMTQELRRLFDQQKRDEHARRQLVANVTHDLRTPLTATAAVVEALQDGFAGDAETRERYLKTISSEIAYMGRLIRDLADVMQLDVGQVRLVKERVNVDDLLAEVLESFGVAMQRRQACFCVEIAAPVPSVAGDATRLRQAMTNVVQNAVAYTPEGGTVQVRLCACGEATGRPRLRLEIEDEGPGIPPEQVERVFERFYRGDPARTRREAGEGGMGLGLAIARDIVALHEGEIGLADRTDGRTGVTLWIELPVA